MTTLIVPLSRALAVRLAASADRLRMTHGQVATIALREFLKAERAALKRPK